MGSRTTNTLGRVQLSAAAFVLVALLFGSALSGCATSNFDGRVYHSDEFDFRVGPTPESWRPIEVDQALLAFRDDQHGATVAVNGRCNVDGDDVPLASLTHHLFLHFTERQVHSQKRIDVAGRESLRTDITASLDGVPRRYIVYVLKKDGCVFDFMLIADSDMVEVQPFDAFVSGFQTVET